MRAHADAGPSSAEAWINCPAYVTRARGRLGASSTYAREGTAAHHVAECILTGKPVPATVEVEGEVFEVTEEMLGHVNKYVTYAQLATYGADFIGVEQRVTLEIDGVGEPLFGTSDLVSYNAADRSLLVADLKYGAGKVVEAAGNPQPRIYALGALRLKALSKAKVESVRMAIIQPRVAGAFVKEEDLSIDELYAWRDEVLIPALQRIDADDGTENPGAHCHWCRRKADCGAMRAKALDKARAAFADPPVLVETLQQPEIAEVLNEAEIVEGWIAAVRAEAQRRIEAGERVPGWRLAPTRPTRKWTDEEAAAESIRTDTGLPFAALQQKPKLLSPAQMEKLLKKEGLAPDILEPLISSESSGVKLVRSDEATLAESFLPL